MSKQTLAQLLLESTRKADEEKADAKQAKRITAAVKTQFAPLLAETNKPLSCPHCGEPLPESWRTDDVTSGTDNGDEDNEQDDDDDDSELDAAGKSRVVAEILKNRRRY